MLDIITPCDSLGTDWAQRVMRDVTQSNLSAFHNTAGGNARSSIEGGISQIKCMIDLTGKASDYIMKIKVEDEKAFKRECLSRDIRHYVKNFRSSEFGVDSFWIDWDTSLTTVRLYTDYPTLLKDCRSLEYLREHIFHHTGSDVKVSSDFVGIIDVQLNELDSTLTKEIKGILDIKLGIDGILEYDNGVVVGSNVASLIKTDLVDARSLWSTHVIQVYEEFGIEAAREVLSSVVGDVLADYATHGGKPAAFNKNRIDLNDKLLLSMGFERVSGDLKLIGKSVKGIKDDASSVQSQIMMGSSPPKIGNNSGFFEVIYDK